MDSSPSGMFSNMLKKGTVLTKILFRRQRLLIFALFLGTMLWGQAEIVDRIAAIVNDEVITLTDIEIVSAFNIEKKVNGNSEDFSLKKELDSLINQKLVIQLEGESGIISREEIKNKLQKIKEDMGLQEFENKLEYFGISEQDILDYLKEKITFQKIIERRFTQREVVSLKEIEDYYNNVYKPSMEKKEETPKPLVEMLDEIESILQKKKSEDKIKEWLKNLRQHSDVIIRID